MHIQFYTILIQPSPAGDADPATDCSETIPVHTHKKVTVGQFVVLGKIVPSKPLNKLFQIITKHMHSLLESKLHWRTVEFTEQVFKAARSSSFHLPATTSDKVRMPGVITNF